MRPCRRYSRSERLDRAAGRRSARAVGPDPFDDRPLQRHTKRPASSACADHIVRNEKRAGSPRASIISRFEAIASARSLLDTGPATAGMRIVGLDVGATSIAAMRVPSRASPGPRRRAGLAPSPRDALTSSLAYGPATSSERPDGSFSAFPSRRSTNRRTRSSSNSCRSQPVSRRSASTRPPFVRVPPAQHNRPTERPVLVNRQINLHRRRRSARCPRGWRPGDPDPATRN